MTIVPHHKARTMLALAGVIIVLSMLHLLTTVADLLMEGDQMAPRLIFTTAQSLVGLVLAFRVTSALGDDR